MNNINKTSLKSEIDS